MCARQISVELMSFIHSNIDEDTLLVSWRNNDGFPVMQMDAAGEFPNKLEKVARFFMV